MVQRLTGSAKASGSNAAILRFLILFAGGGDACAGWAASLSSSSDDVAYRSAAKPWPADLGL